MAIAVLIYHFMSWTIGVPDSSSILGRLGIYAVSIFYIASGMSLFVAYQYSTWNAKDTLYFFAKRYLRLLPAFWVACTMVVLLLSVTSPTFVIPKEKLVLNYTLLFGFFAPGDYITAGGWSIGNEIVFYVFFPLVMILPRFRPALIVLSLLISLFYYVYFSFYKLTLSDYLGNQWLAYIDPLNQAFLFFLGVGIAWASTRYKASEDRNYLAILVISVFAFCLYPASGNQINIVYGTERLVFTGLCGLCCFAVFNTRFKFRPAIEKTLYIAGCVSYSLYMFHGVFADFTLQIIAPKIGIETNREKLIILLLFTLPVLMVFVYAFYRFVETPFMNLGRSLKQGSVARVSA
ncbi:acyltransferase [Pseudomonas cichorii]|nr:acyltransferase [Pseudomonas cichorii]